jgi:hypothetical protein
MTGLSNSRNAGSLWLIGALLAVSLTVVVPIHLGHRFFSARNTVHAGLRAAHHTIVDQLDGRLEARIDRAGRDAAPKRIAAAAVLSASSAPGVLARATAAPPPVRRLRRLRIARSRAGDGDPSSHATSLRA